MKAFNLFQSFKTNSINVVLPFLMFAFNNKGSGVLRIWAFTQLLNFARFYSPNYLIKSAFAEAFKIVRTQFAILAPCLPNLPSLISSRVALILVPSVPLDPLISSFQGYELSRHQRHRQHQQRQERTHSISYRSLPEHLISDMVPLGLFEKTLVVKHCHLERSYLVFWDCLFWWRRLSVERLRSDASRTLQLKLLLLCG